MELSLDLGPVFVPKTVDQCLKEVAKVKDTNQKLSKLDDFVNRLEDERRKIEGFRRELPLCFLLLTDAILKLKEEALAVKRNSCGKDEEEEKKKSWLDSVQLWKIGNSSCKSEQKQRSEEEDDRSTCENPIKKGRKEEEKEVVSQATELSLMTPFPHGNEQQLKVQTMNKPRLVLGQQQFNKKQRRCWAPELHRMFVDVLEELGGPHVATPKQIREKMQVERLTNDEVKSHLQKYRLHIRKHSASSSGQAKYGGNCNEASTDVNLLHSGSPQGPLVGSNSSNEGHERSESS
ncbi:Transcription factor HHO5 [Linum perenne]